LNGAVLGVAFVILILQCWFSYTCLFLYFC